MQTSENIGKISEALAKAQGQIQPAVFDAMNPHFKSKYATLASIMESCRDALSQNGLAVVQGVSVEANRVVITTMLAHSSGEWLRDQLAMNAVKDGPQAVGSIITYGRRYALSAMIGIVADQDDDGETAERGKPESGEKTSKTAKEKSVQKPTIPPKTQINARVGKIRSIFNLSAKIGHSPDQMKQVIGELVGIPGGIKESSDIPDDKLDVIVEAFSSQLEALQNQAERVAA